MKAQQTLKTFVVESKHLNLALEIFTLSCDAPMMRAVADVKPTVTGSEMRSTKAPSLRSAMRSSTMPERKQRSTAKCGPEIPPLAVWRLVMRAKRAVGPIVTSRHPPSRA